MGAGVGIAVGDGVGSGVKFAVGIEVNIDVGIEVGEGVDAGWAAVSERCGRGQRAAVGSCGVEGVCARWGQAR